MPKQILTALNLAPDSYGTDAMKSLLATIYRQFPLDKDGNGTIDGAEWSSPAFAIISSFFNPNLLAEGSDITLEEGQYLLDWTGQHFPELAGLSDENEEVVAAVADLLAAALRTFRAVKALSKRQNEPEVPVVEPVAPEVTEAKRQKLQGLGLSADLGEAVPGSLEEVDLSEVPEGALDETELPDGSDIKYPEPVE